MIISDPRNKVLVCVCLIVVFELHLLLCPYAVTIVAGLLCLFSAVPGCSEHTHFISYVQNKPTVPVPHLFNAHPSVISHLLVPAGLFCFGQSSHKHQNHLVINYSCLFKRTRTEWLKEIWSLSAFGNTNTSGCYWSLRPRQLSEFYQHHPLTLHFVWQGDTFSISIF